MMKLFVSLSLILLPPVLPCQQEKIHEKVEVVNIELPVRVFQKGRPVDGLTRDDFRIFRDGREIPINGFYVSRKKLELNKAAVVPPRLFVLILNLTDYALDYRKGIAGFFDSVLRPDDHLLVLSNLFFLDDRVISDPQKEKENVSRLIAEAQAKMRLRILQQENNLSHLSDDLARGLSAEDLEPDEIHTLLVQFCQAYTVYLKEYKDLCLSLTLRDWIRLVGYLEKQKLDKWVFNCCARGAFPMIRRYGRLDRLLREALERLRGDLTGSGGALGPVIERLFLDLDKELDNASYKLDAEVSKMFINSEAIFHTLLMKPLDRRMMDDFELQPIGTDWEMASRQISESTGGSVVFSNDAEQFYREIGKFEDLLYVLTYAPTGDEGRAPPPIKVTVKRDNCKLLYDDMHRRWFVNRVVEAVEDETPKIKLWQVRFQAGVLQFAVADFMSQETERGEKGQISVRIKVTDDKAGVLLDRAQDMDIFSGGEEVRIKLDNLPAGSNSLVVEVTDRLTGKKVIEVVEIKKEKLPDQEVNHEAA